jgi:hypothetical protein
MECHLVLWFRRGIVGSCWSCGYRRAGSFFEGVDGVGLEIGEFLEKAARPADLNPIDSRGRTEAKVHAHVIVGVETRGFCAG